MGSLMTSLEMAGVSVTLIKLTSNWTNLLGVLVISEVVVCDMFYHQMILLVLRHGLTHHWVLVVAM